MDIFVGSLPFKLKDAELKDLFERFGEVKSVTIIINSATRQNKGFGFVNMPNETEAIEAISKLNGFEILDRKIIVSKAEPRKDSSNKDDNKKIKLAEGQSSDKTWSRKLYKKKPKEQIITYGDKPKKDNHNEMGRKKAKNFKVGSRKKR